MLRISPRAIATRAYHGSNRGTVRSIDDNRMMQETHSDMMKDDSRQKMERAQNYGMTSAILPAEEGSDESAEAFFNIAAGNRAHPVATVIDDRRHRPRGLKPGESAQYDDIGQMTLLRRDFTRVLSLDTEAEGDKEKKERYASLAHVKKKKQPKPKTGINADQQKQQDKETQDFKHEGDEVNTEVRTTAKRIEFRVANTVVGYYDKEAQKWVFIGEVRLGGEGGKLVHRKDDLDSDDDAAVGSASKVYAV